MKKELIRTERYIHIFDEAGKQLAHLPLDDSPILEGVPLLPPLDEGVFITPTHFEFETEITHEGNGTYSTDLMDIGLSNLTPIKVIKTTTNSQGQQVVCGKYIY